MSIEFDRDYFFDKTKQALLSGESEVCYSKEEAAALSKLTRDKSETPLPAFCVDLQRKVPNDPA